MQKVQQINSSIKYKDKSHLKFSQWLVFFNIIISFFCYYFMFISTPNFVKYELFFIFLRFFFSLLLFISVINYVNKNTRTLYFIFLAFITMSYLSHFSGLAYLMETVYFFNLLISLSVVKLNKKQIQIVFFSFFFFVILLMFFAPIDGEKHFLSKIQINPNFSGFCITLFSMILTMLAIYKKRWYYYVAIIVLFFFQFRFNSRTAIFGSLIWFCLVFALFRKWRPNSKTIFILIIVTCFVAIALAYFYSMILVEIVGQSSFFILGKDFFTGRELIWKDAFTQLQTHWFFGIGNRLDSILLGPDVVNKGTNLHNQMMGVLTVFGAPVCIVYILLIANIFVNTYNKNNNIYSIAFIITILIMSYFETILYSINASLIIATYALIVSLNKKGGENANI